MTAGPSASGSPSMQDGWAAHFCRFEPLPDNLTQPLALRYHGHQFRVYNPEIGDGRGFLFAQLRDDRGRLLDLGTKGSGQTPYSRHADGRLTLKGGVREVLATEMLEALGVNTSKSFALFETGEALERGDEPSPTRSAVLTRLSHGHIRIGTFQRLAFFGEVENIRKLVRYCLENLYGESRATIRAAAVRSGQRRRRRRLAASYLAAGFVHGVLNSDNINVTGESFDYGPWRFTPDWDPEFTAAYFDHYGLYAFGRQPEAIHWDLAQLGRRLSLVAEAPQLSECSPGGATASRPRWSTRCCRRLGVARRGDDQRSCRGADQRAGDRARRPIDRFFFDWRGGRDPGAKRLSVRAVPRAGQGARRSQPARPRTHIGPTPAPCSMHIEEVEAIWSAIAERDDWQPFDDKVRAIRRMGEAMEQDAPAG